MRVSAARRINLPPLLSGLFSKSGSDQGGDFQFEILHKSKKPGSRARVGRLTTPHGSFETPSFVPVGTNASMKCIPTSKMDTIYAKQKSKSLMFCNTYHLMLHPGPEVIEKAGGLHKFMNHPHPLITDSGGFQVFSLAYGSVQREISTAGQKLETPATTKTPEEITTEQGVKKQRKFASGNSVIKIDENGVLFRSYRDGRKILLTPEISVQAQKSFGADIIIPFDELPPYHIGQEALKASLDRTHRWQKRSLVEHLKNPKRQAMYGIVHGGMDESFRAESSKFVNENAFDGTAIGGSLGKTRQDVQQITDFVTRIVNPERPIHLLGIGDLESMEKCVPFGVDTFDSAYPTRCARHGLLFSSKGPVKIVKRIHLYSNDPIEPGCPCDMCTNHSRSYIHHLFKANEPTYAALATEHNVVFYYAQMQKFRDAIRRNEI